MTNTITYNKNRIAFNDLRVSVEKEWTDEIDTAILRVMESGTFIGGKEVQAFEEEWAAYIGTKYCVSCGNGHDALQLVLRVLHNTGIFSLAHVSPFTCLPTWQAVRNARMVPLPLMPGSRDLAVAVPVHLYGMVSEPPDARYIVEDCAQAHGSEWGGIKAGALGYAGCWSFYPTKNLGALGDAGAITVNNEGLAQELRDLANYGEKRLGINSRMDSLQAAILSAKLPWLEEWNMRRTLHADYYNRHLYDIPEIQLPQVPKGCKPNWHQYAIMAQNRTALRSYLARYGIQTLVHYPVAPTRALTEYSLPEVDDWVEHTLSLPVGPHLTDTELMLVCEHIHEFYREASQ